MSAQSMADAWAPVEEEQFRQVQRETWGHLAPKKNKKYAGRIVYAIGCFGSDNLNPTPLFCDLKGLDSSPWFYDALLEWLQEEKTEEGCVYEFVGYFLNYEFVGSHRLIFSAAKEGE